MPGVKGRSGRTPIPHAMKLLQGTARGDRPQHAVDLPAVDSVPEPPEWLTEPAALAEWRRVAPLLVELGLMIEACTQPLAHLCALHARMVDVWKKGSTPPATVIAQYKGLCSEFGLTPMSHSRLRAPGAGDNGAKQRGNRFAGHGKRPA